MPNTLQIKRGGVANIGTLATGEPFFSTDTNKAFFGDGASNHAVVMEEDTDLSGMDFFLDEDDMLSNDAAKVASQQSIKAYVDGKLASPMNYEGAYDAAANSPDLDSSPSGVSKGDTYTVTAAGDFFTEAVEVGDVLIAEADNATTLADWTIVNKNIDAATTTTKGIVELATDGESAADKVVQGNDSRLSDSRTPTAHASTHVDGGSDELDGDTLDVDFTPSYYTPDASPAEANDVDDLAAHLQGVDTQFNTHATATTDVHGAGANTILHSGSTIDCGTV